MKVVRPDPRPSGTSPRLPGEARASLEGAAFLAAYVFLDWLSYIHASGSFAVTPWNPQPALAIFLIMKKGQRVLPLVALAVALSEVLVRGVPASYLGAALAALSLTLGYATTAQWLVGNHGPSLPIASRGDLLRLLGGVTVGTLFTGLIYIGTSAAAGTAGTAAAPESLLKFWIGDCVGILVTLPLILTLGEARGPARLRVALRQYETALQVGVSIALLWFVLRGPVAEQIRHFYLLFLPVTWVAARHGLAGASLAIGAMQVGVILAVHEQGYPTDAVYELQAVMITLAATGFFLGVTVDEGNRFAIKLRESLRLASAGKMAASLAHELNQPLTALTSYAASARRMARMPEVNPELLSRTLDSIGAEAMRAAEVVRRMRDFFRIGALQLQPLRLDSLVKAVVDTFARELASRSVEIRLLLADAPAIQGDALQLEIVLRNLIANACQALGEGPSPRWIEIGLQERPDGFVAAFVRDNGPGIRPEVRSQLFEPFSTTRATGMGMGLAISRAIVEAHGGALWVEESEGTCFRFTLPSRESADA